MALPWVLKNYLRIGGGRLTGSLMLDGGEAAEGVESSGSTWIRYKSGLQICWGWSGAFSARNNSSKTFTFAKSFKTAPHVLCSHSAGGNNWASYTETTNSTTTTGTIVTWVSYGSDNEATVGYQWLAIGFWK